MSAREDRAMVATMLRAMADEIEGDDTITDAELVRENDHRRMYRHGEYAGAVLTRSRVRLVVRWRS